VLTQEREITVMGWTAPPITVMCHRNVSPQCTCPIEKAVKQIQTVEDVYPAFEKLIAELKLGSHSELADILHHRMHQVAWAARSELFEELQSILTEALQSDGASLPEPIKNEMQQAVRIIRSYLQG
jgi:hypothetical protein